MALVDDIVAWVNKRPSWQRGAILRFCKEEEYSPEEISELADRLISEELLEVPLLTPEDIPGGSKTGAQVALHSLRDVTGVNALLSGQELVFEQSGLTVIFGNNGSGKSGYGRLLREAVTARIKGALLGDVFSKESPVQAASLKYLVDGVQQTWSLTDLQHPSLTSVRFYDSACGSSYISRAEEITYRPYALTLLDRLQVLCRAVKDVIDTKIALNEQAMPELPDLPEGTEARKFVDGLTKSTTLEEIASATRLDDDHADRLVADKQEIARLVASNPQTEKARLTKLASRWGVVGKYLTESEALVGVDAIEVVSKAKKSAADLRKAADAASAKQFNAEALGGMDSEYWRALWEAAREFSTKSAYSEHSYPHTDGGAVCVLCQQALSETAAERLNRFEKFVADTTSRQALVAENRLKELRLNYDSLSSMPNAVTEAIAKLSAAAEDTSDSVIWLEKCFAVAENVVNWIEDGAEELPNAIDSSPDSEANARRDALNEKAASVDTDTYGAALSALRARSEEAEARGLLFAAAKSLALASARLDERWKLEQAKQQTITTKITQKATALTTEYATVVARETFARETEQLGLRRITLSPTKGRGAVTLEHRPSLVGATNAAAVGDVLSEGEQTALGLAGFLTEVELDDSKSAVVFDDPVTSLDAGRRSHVAGRLMKLASERQVVVFTHEITFVAALLKEARNLGQKITPRSIQRQGSIPGKVTKEFPWQAKDVSQRIDQLRREIARFKRERDAMDDEQYMKEIRSWAGDLSETWERAVNLEVVDQIVDRGTSQVKPLKLKILQHFTEEDHDEFQNGYGKVSGWAGRHDNAPEENFHAPDIAELESELERVTTWYEKIRKYKN